MSSIEKIKAREILDSRRKKTIEVELKTNDGKFLASVPSGTSKGKYEAVAKKARIAVKNVNKIIAPKLEGSDSSQQKKIDEILMKLDGTKNKSYLGANAILAVSLAICRAGARAKKMPLWKWISEIGGTKPSLPTPYVLFIEGGLHGQGLDFQEFMGFIGKGSFKNKFRTGVKIYHNLGKILKKKYGKVAAKLGLEGAFVPPIKKTEEALDLLVEATQKNKTRIILDAAASSFFRKGKYYFEKKKLNRKEFSNFYLEICQKYPIIAIEDPFSEKDWQGWKMLRSKVLRIADDLTVTNPERIKLAYQRKACDAVILKPNQIGTVSEVIKAAKLAKKYGWKTIVSHRSGETKDNFIADLSVGLGADFIKAGAPSKIERMVKYKRLLKIEKELK